MCNSEPYSYDLPEQAEDEVRFAGLQVLRSNVDNITADGLGGRQR